MTRFIIVRHGHTKGTEKQRYFGRTDMPLSLQGISQIKYLKKNIGRLPVDYIYTSPLKRCVQTASILKGNKSAKIEVSNDLIEIDFGDWEGLTLYQMMKRNPKKFNTWLKDFPNFHMPNGESVVNMVKRVKIFWKNVLGKHKNENVLITSHGGPSKVIIMDVLGLSMRYFWRLSIDTGSISLIESSYSIPLVKAVNLWGRLS